MVYIFYKITCNSVDVDSVYIGYTKNFQNKKCFHKMRSLFETNTSKLDTAIRAHAGFKKNWTMEVIESSACESLEDAKKQLPYLCEVWKADLNTVPKKAIKK
jgi:hypothetical protein